MYPRSFTNDQIQNNLGLSTLSDFHKRKLFSCNQFTSPKVIWDKGKNHLVCQDLKGLLIDESNLMATLPETLPDTFDCYLTGMPEMLRSVVYI